MVCGLLTACPSQPVPGDTETDTGAATASGSETATTTSDDPPTTGDPTSTTTTGTSTGESTTTEGVSATETSTSTGEATTSTSTGEATTSTSSGPDTSTSTGEETTTTSTGPDTSSTGGPPGCGDGVVQPGEACDDGANADLDDGCLPSCELGMGAPLDPLVIPKPAGADDLRCMAPLPGWFLDASAMIVGRALADFGPEGQTAAQLFEVSLPGGDDPGFWDITEWAGEHGRAPLQAEGIQGQAVVAGIVDTEAQEPGSGGHMWLANVGGDGSTAFFTDYVDLPVAVTDLAWTGGDIAVVGNHAAGGAGAWVLRFDGGGALMWQHDAPVGVGWTVRYRGVAIDDVGTIYAVGERHADDDASDQLFLEALSPEGLPLWDVMLPAPTHAHALPTDVVVTGQTGLAVALTQFDGDVPQDSLLGYAMFAAADGAQLWWQEWAPPDGWSVRAGPVEAEPFGGMFVGVGEHDGDQSRTRVLRIDQDGAVLWATQRPGGDVRDLVFASQPERVYALTKDAILPYHSW